MLKNIRVVVTANPKKEPMRFLAQVLALAQERSDGFVALPQNYESAFKTIFAALGLCESAKGAFVFQHEDTVVMLAFDDQGMVLQDTKEVAQTIVMPIVAEVLKRKQGEEE